MNKKDLIKQRTINRNKYRYMGTNNYPPILVNKTIHQNSESIKHELTCYMIDLIVQRGGDVRIIFPMIKDLLVDFAYNMETIIEPWCFKGSERDIICQAVRDNRRIDRVILDSGEEIEVETNPKISKNATTVYI